MANPRTNDRRETNQVLGPLVGRRVGRSALWAFFMIGALLVLPAVPVFARHAPIEQTLEETEAVAYIRVTSVVEELQGEMMHRHATLTVMGESYGLKGATSLVVGFGRPWKFPGSEGGAFAAAASDAPFFLLGHRSIVLLRHREGRWIVLRQIYLSDKGEVLEPKVFIPVGFDRGAEANDAVKQLGAFIEPRLRDERSR